MIKLRLLFLKRLGIVLFAVLVFSCIAFSQGTRRTMLTGVVIDDEGAQIPLAKIVVLTETKKRFETTSDQDGTYVISLEPGIYTIRVTYSPFLPLEIKEYQIAYVKKMRLDLSLICKDCTKTVLESNPDKTRSKSNTKSR